MENQKRDKSSVEEKIKRIVRPIFDKVLQEKPFNHTMVGKHGSKIKKTVTPALYNPHNYRLYFNFTKEKYTPKEGMVGVWFGKFKNYGKEFTVIGEGIRVTIKKTKAEIINKLSEEEWFSVNKAKAKEEVLAIINKIDEKCIRSFKKFMEVYGGSSDLIILNREDKVKLILNTKCDNKVMKEKFIDNIPLNTRFETSIVKKVYKKPNVEFKEPIYAAQYLENSALNDFSPEISRYLKVILQTVKGTIEANASTSKTLNQFVTQFLPIQADFAVNIKSHTKVIKEMAKGFKRFNRLLSERQKRLGEYL